MVGWSFGEMLCLKFLQKLFEWNCCTWSLWFLDLNDINAVQLGQWVPELCPFFKILICPHILISCDKAYMYIGVSSSQSVIVWLIILQFGNRLHQVDLSRFAYTPNNAAHQDLHRHNLDVEKAIPEHDSSKRTDLRHGWTPGLKTPSVGRSSSDWAELDMYRKHRQSWHTGDRNIS